MSTEDLDKRVGKFSIPYETVVEHPDLIKNVLTGTIVIWCQMVAFPVHQFEYCAIGSMFAEVPSGDHVPFYEIEISEDDHGDQVVTWVHKG